MLSGHSVVLLSYVSHVLCITSPYGWEKQRNLAGLWNFKTSPQNDQEVGFRERWWTKKLQGEVLEMAVPSSFNDIPVDSAVRDYLGWVWYQSREPLDCRDWAEYRKVIHFGGVHYNTLVWYGERLVGSHEGGHVPFELELPEVVGTPDWLAGYLTVAVNNTLTNHTIPQGSLAHHSDLSGPYTTYHHDFDYFDYAGINRNVILYATSKEVYVKDLAVRTYTDLYKNRGFVKYKVTLGFSQESIQTNASCLVQLSDETSSYSTVGCESTFTVLNPRLWYNLFSEYGTPHLYTLSVEVNSSVSSGSTVRTVYRSQVGIRQIQWTNQTLLLNERPLYLRGFGRHEDSEIRGRGFDWVTLLRDMELLKWTGANAIRSAHYPPALELVEAANRAGLLLVLESPACSLSHFDSEILERHKSVMREIFAVYGSNPSVLMWSLANEPLSRLTSADKYFKELVELMHRLDSTRPVTFVTAQQPETDQGAKYVDVICINRYNGWYSAPGELGRVHSPLRGEVLRWRQRFNVPLIVTEYGAGSLSGLHTLPSSMWSEDYQTDLLKEHFKVFDELRASGDLAGEMLWAFADFATPQEYIRPGACVKGIFTRSRQPKKAAFTIKERYLNMNTDNNSLPFLHKKQQPTEMGEKGLNAVILV